MIITFKKYELDALTRCAAKGTTRYAITGVCMHLYKDGCKLAATDTHQLMTFKAGECTGEHTEQIILTDSFKSLARRIGSGVSATYRLDTDHIQKSDILDGQYPKWEDVIDFKGVKFMRTFDGCFAAAGAFAMTPDLLREWNTITKKEESCLYREAGAVTDMLRGELSSENFEVVAVIMLISNDPASDKPYPVAFFEMKAAWEGATQ